MIFKNYVVVSLEGRRWGVNTSLMSTARYPKGIGAWDKNP